MSRQSHPFVREMIREAVEELGSPTTNVAVQDWIAEHYPGANRSTVQCHFTICCVNQASRVHYPENQRPRIAEDPRYDFLFRPARGKLEWYSPEEHGVWAIEQDDEANFAISCDDGELIYTRTRRRKAADVTTTRPLRAAIPILASQVDAARRLHDRLEQWSATGRAFERLKESFPGFDREACILKGAAINDLYTKVFAIWRMAEHLMHVMEDPLDDPAALVEAIASLLSEDGSSVERRHWSFASKICHFFVDEERFPIYDSFCRDMIAYHLGRGRSVSDLANPYRAFMENLQQLKQLSGLSASLRELDRYMWLAGQYRAWLKHGAEARTKSELRSLFKDRSATVQQELQALSGEPATRS